MAQFGCNHLYLTARLLGNSGTTWEGEQVVFGQRIGVRTTAAQTSLSEGVRDLDPFLVNDASVTRSLTNWTVTQNWAGDAADASANVSDSDQDSILDAFWTFLNDVKTYLGGGYSLEACRLYAILTSTHNSATAPNEYVPTATYSVTSSILGPDVALCLSTETQTRGPRGRGRMYLGPMAASGSSTTGLVPSATRTAVATAGKDFFDAVRDAGDTVDGPRYYPMVWHRGTSTASVINGVRVGDEWDHQSRRRRQRNETYTSLALA
jgi:hypothetical protein